MVDVVYFIGHTGTKDTRGEVKLLNCEFRDHKHFESANIEDAEDQRLYFVSIHFLSYCIKIFELQDFIAVDQQLEKCSPKRNPPSDLSISDILLLDLEISQAI